MALIKYTPFNDVDAYDRSFGRLMDSFFDRSREPDMNWVLVPKADVKETEAEYQIQLEMPGVDKEQVKINVENRVLTISAERKGEQQTNKDSYLYQEIRYGRISKSFTLPEGIETEKIDAKLERGILALVIPKAETQKPRQIEVKVA